MRVEEWKLQIHSSTLGSFLRGVEVFTHLRPWNIAAYGVPGRMATDARIRNIIIRCVHWGSTNKWSTARITGRSVSNINNTDGVYGLRSHQVFHTAATLRSNNVAVSEVCFGHLRRAYECQIASPGRRWSRLPRNLATSARLHFLVP
jgi:hypothetical protein